ncbi:MAG: hypothetical protein AAFQ94_21040 [Bacteroidota bacterium]
MKKQKLKLDVLKVNSFSTSEVKEIKGGASAICQDTWTGACCQSAYPCEIAPV